MIIRQKANLFLNSDLILIPNAKKIVLNSKNELDSSLLKFTHYSHSLIPISHKSAQKKKNHLFL